MSITWRLFTFIVFSSLNGVMRGSSQLCGADICCAVSRKETKLQIVISAEASRIYPSVRTNFAK